MKFSEWLRAGIDFADAHAYGECRKAWYLCDSGEKHKFCLLAAAVAADVPSENFKSLRNYALHDWWFSIKGKVPAKLQDGGVQLPNPTFGYKRNHLTTITDADVLIRWIYNAYDYRYFSRGEIVELLEEQGL